jgi:hypothetical protein
MQALVLIDIEYAPNLVELKKGGCAPSRSLFGVFLGGDSSLHKRLRIATWLNLQLYQALR